jgi:hypothetical protein
MRYVRHRRLIVRPHFVGIAVVLGLAACGDDSTSPRLESRIAISVADLDGPVISETPSGEPRIRCEVTFAASASGRGSAVWRDATFKFFVGPDREEPVDSILMPASEVHEVWSDTALAAGTQKESRWFFESGAPFAITADFRYVPAPGAAVAVASASFECGPEVPATSTPPVITELTLTPAGDSLEPGGQLIVSYKVTSDVGIWATAIELTGACEAFLEYNDRLNKNVVRSEAIKLPSGCTLRTPIIVNVYAADAALRVVSRGARGPLIVDHTPPRVHATLLRPEGAHTPTAIGFAGDSLGFAVMADDNNGIRTIVYELLPAGHRDSVAVAPSFQGILYVPIPEDASGFVQVRFYARDLAGNTSPEFTTSPDEIRVLPTVERPTLHTALFDGGVTDIVIDVRGSIYVLRWNGSTITVVSTQTLQVTRTIDLPYLVTSVDFTTGGDSLIVTGSAELGVVDLRPATPVLTHIPLPTDPALRTVRVVVLDNGKAYVALTNTSSSVQKLLEVELATGQSRIRSEPADGNGNVIASAMQRSPDRTAFVFNGGRGHFWRYDANTDRFTPGADVTWPGVLFSLDRGGRHSAMWHDIYDASLTFVRRVESIYGSATFPRGSSLSADGEYLYHLGPPGIMRSRVSDGVLIDRTPNPIAGEIIRVASDDSFLVTGSEPPLAALSLIRLR